MRTKSEKQQKVIQSIENKRIKLTGLIESAEKILFSNKDNTLNLSDSEKVEEYKKLSSIYSVKNNNERDESFVKYFNGEMISVEGLEKKDNSQLFNYNGNKNKFSSIFQKTFPKVSEGVNTVTDVFFGQGGSTTVLEKQMKESGVKNLVLNEFNTTIYQLHKDVMENPDDLIEVCLSIYERIYNNFGTLNIGKEEIKLVVKGLKEEINEYERVGDLNIYTSAVFLILNSVSFNGVYKYDFENKVSKEFSVSSDMSKFFRGFFTIPTKIKERSRVYNSFNTTFRNEDGIELMRELKGDNVLFLIDPPYLEINSDEVVDCRGNYGVEDLEGGFNHLGLLEVMVGTNYIYNNNKNGTLNRYMDLCREYNENVNLISIYKKCSTGRTDITSVKGFLIEYLMYRNVNNTSYSKEMIRCS